MISGILNKRIFQYRIDQHPDIVPGFAPGDGKRIRADNALCIMKVVWKCFQVGVKRRAIMN